VGQPLKKKYFLVGRESLLGTFNPAIVAICGLQKIAVAVSVWILRANMAMMGDRKIGPQGTG
jgi:hypothetical protein